MAVFQLQLKKKIIYLSCFYSSIIKFQTFTLSYYLLFANKTVVNKNIQYT